MTTDPEHAPMDPAAEAALLEQLRNDLNSLPARLARAREIEREATAKAKLAEAKHAVVLSAHQTELDQLEEQRRAKWAAKEREIANRENAVGQREHIVEEKDQRATARMRDAENRAADLSNRLHGHAA